MKEKYERLKDIAATYGYDKVEEETEKKLIISNGYFHELRILCDDVERKFGMRIVNKVYDSTIFTVITYHYGEFLMEFEKTLKININRVFKESMRMINLDEKIKYLKRRIFNLEQDNIVHYDLLKEFHYELFKIKMNLIILNGLVISYISYQVINYIWGK